MTQTRLILIEDCKLGSRWDIVDTDADTAFALMGRQFAYADTPVRRRMLEKRNITLNDRTSPVA